MSIRPLVKLSYRRRPPATREKPPTQGRFFGAGMLRRSHGSTADGTPGPGRATGGLGPRRPPPYLRPGGRPERRATARPAVADRQPAAVGDRPPGLVPGEMGAAARRRAAAAARRRRRPVRLRRRAAR